MTGHEFHRLRRQLGLSVKQAAKILSIPDARLVRRIEAGTMPVLERVAAKLRQLVQDRQA